MGAFFKFSNGICKMITVVLTSCGRLDLLKKTVDSFLKFNDYPIKEFIIIDDSGDNFVHDSIREAYPQWTLILKDHRGQIVCIDDAYSMVKTPYIFHMEDDWEFIRGGFMQLSLEILENDIQAMQVFIVNQNDHPLELETYKINNIEYKYLGHYQNWKGFSFNPGLRRLSEWKLIGPFMNIGKYESSGLKEWEIGEEYYKRGFKAAILPDKYCYHIGEGRRVL